LGGFLGALLGIIAGVTISFLVSDNHKPMGLVDGCVSILAWILMPFIFGGIGGVIGAVGGAVLGTALAIPSRDREIEAPPRRQAAQDTSSPVLGEESTKTELARLKERIAELEEQKRKAEPEERLMRKPKGRQERGEEGSSAVNPSNCPACGSAIGSQQARCPECDIDLT
jgi:hypothetical protein